LAEGFRVTPIRDQSDLAKALSQPRAFLFLWVNWAIHARNSRLVVDEVIAGWQAEQSDQSVPCYIADISDQCGELWDALAEWLTTEGCPAGHLMMSGVGPLLWVRSGHVVLHVLAPLQYGGAKLAAASRSVFD
jgi:phosphatidate phosphatase APP1